MSATVAPTPGAVKNSIRGHPRAEGPKSLLQFLPLLEKRAATSASATADSVVWPATSSQIRPAKVRGVVGPTYSPKPHSTPRTLISTSWFLVCNRSRAVSSALISCAGSDLQCTGTKPTEPYQLGDATRVFPIGFDWHCLE